MAALINTAIGIIVISILYRLTDRVYITIAASAGIGYIYSLLTYHNIAFNRRTGSPPYVKYAIVYIIACSLNSALTFVGLRLLSSFVLVQMFVIPIVVLLQWFASTFWAFSSNGNKIG